MNKVRRKSIDEIIAKIQKLSDEIECIIEGEEEYLDNLPKNLQDFERYERADDACSAMKEAYNNLEEAVWYLEIAAE